MVTFHVQLNTVYCVFRKMVPKTFPGVIKEDLEIFEVQEIRSFLSLCAVVCKLT